MTQRRQFLSVRNVMELGLLVLLGLVALHYQTILDDYALATFHPNPAVGAMITRLGLTAQAKAAMYRAQPQIDGKSAFNTDCQTQPHELELGCYFRGRIYVLQIDNDSLAPEMDVVSAHELLHAEWARLDPTERRTLGGELEAEYRQLNDPNLKQRMAEYAQTEPGEQDNELHSILGTEYANLSPVLEAHYASYFTDRSKIVVEHAEYQAVFDGRSAELAQDLATIRSEKARLASLNSQMTGLKDSGQIAAYNALVPRQNNLVGDINVRIAQYQQAVDEYNALSKSLDSQIITDTETSAQ